MATRFAIYAAPPVGSMLDRLGGFWLGRDAASFSDCHQPTVLGIAQDRIREMTRRVRRHGFHGTLKAPFALAPGKTEVALRAAITDFCQDRAPVAIPGFKVGHLNGALALFPTSPCEALHALAADCVRYFEGFRAPLPLQERSCRQSGSLSALQRNTTAQRSDQNVLQTFQFHIPLTDPLEDSEERDLIIGFLESFLGGAGRWPVTFKDLALFRQSDATARFQLIQRFPLCRRPQSSESAA